MREMDLSLERFLDLSEEEQLPWIGHQAILYAQQFQRADLDRYCAVSDACRALHREPSGAAFLASLLRHRMALNLFAQPSSRTFLSFQSAEAFLGLNRASVRDLATSSMSKGESLVDSVRTFISYADVVVMRHPDGDAAATAWWTALRARRRVRRSDGSLCPVPIISAGAGTRQHPTQALLDIYTLQRALRPVGGLDGKTLLMVGDLKRGRTVRSLCYLLPQYRDVTVLFASPERYRMLPDITDHLDAHGVRWETVGTLRDGLPHADAVYMTRIQDEWDERRRGGHAETPADFVFRLDDLDRMRPHAPLLHPLPKRDEIEVEVDDADDPRVAYWRQERNGMWMRMAVLARLFGVDQRILDEHGRSDALAERQRRP